MVEWLGFEKPGPDPGSWDAALRSILDTLSTGFPPEVRQKYENLLRVATWAMGEGATRSSAEDP